MKRITILLAMTVWTIGAMAQLKRPTATVIGDINAYSYYFIVPTGSVTSSSEVHGNQFGVFGGGTRTVTPSEVISGYLMKNGYNVITFNTPELADKTLIVSYGYTGRRSISALAYVSGIIIQMKDAKTQELVASFEAEGYGSDETDDILEAILSSMDMFSYCIQPSVKNEVLEEYSKNISLRITNLTPDLIRQVVLKLSYYLDGELVHEQEVKVAVSCYPGEAERAIITRPKQFRSKKLKIQYEVVSYS